VPCDQPHEYETIHILELDGEAYPGVAAIDARVGPCVAAAEEWMGVPFTEDSRYDVWYHYPTELTWRLGDRRVVCSLTSPDGSMLTGSARGSRPA